MDERKKLAANAGTEKKRVRMLLRVSSDQQLESDGDLNVQRQLVLDYIQRHSQWILDEKEYFEGSSSGYKNAVADREILQEAYRDAKNHEYEILVVYKDDRIGRRMWEIGGYIMSLKSLGVDIYTVKDGCISPDSNDIMGQMMLALRYGNAQKSSADTGMRVKDTAQKLVQAGKFMGGKAPYGYLLEHSGEISKHGRALKHLVIQKERAEAVKYIYQLSLEKEYGSVKIAKTLNQDDRYRELAPNDVWKSGTITSILTNPIYAGYTAYNRRESLNGRHRSLNSEEWILSREANPDIVIIEENTWREVQKKRERRNHQYTKSQKNQDLTVIKRNDGMLSLADVLYCGYCGCKMVNGSKYNYWTIKDTKERKTSKTAIYKCQNAAQGVPHNKTKQFRADEIEPVIYEILAEYISKLQKNDNIIELILEHHKQEIQRKKQELETAQSELNKIRSGIYVMEDRIPEAITGVYALTLEDLVHNIHIQKEKEQKQLALLHEKEIMLQDCFDRAKDWQKLVSGVHDNSNVVISQNIRKIPTWREIFLSADISTKRVLINKLTERIDVTKERLVIRLCVGQDESLPESRINGYEVVPKQRL